MEVCSVNSLSWFVSSSASSQDWLKSALLAAMGCGVRFVESQDWRG